MRGLRQHLLLTLRLNLRSRQALAYGYLVPIFFLIGFGSVFRSGQPRLGGEMGMLLTITILGGACFGMPTAMVAERERGVWRRYRLLPAATGALILSTMAARFLIIASAVVLQIALARLIYGTPLPTHPGQMLIAFSFVAFAFESMGLIIAMLADTVPAVQALGQSIFLPMILIGGVGVPLRLLPRWAQTVAGFLPGVYSVHALQVCAEAGTGLSQAGFDLIALAIIGLCACIAGTGLFRWDIAQTLPRRARTWIFVALAAWACIGGAAWTRQNSANAPPTASRAAAPSTDHAATTFASTASAFVSTKPPPWKQITSAQIDAVKYDDLSDDASNVAPVVDIPAQVDSDAQKWINDFRPKLAAWPPAQISDPAQRTRNLLSLCAVADLARDEHEAEFPYLAFAQLRSQIPSDDLTRILTWIINHPYDGDVILTAPELGITDSPDDEFVRTRAAQYAKKLLGRILGKLGA